MATAAYGIAKIRPRGQAASRPTKMMETPTYSESLIAWPSTSARLTVATATRRAVIA